MAIYDGVVTLAEDDIPVVIELDADRVRMSASGTEIGDWPADECEITRVANATYSIRAEDEIITFVPNQPTLFAAAVNGTVERPQPAVAMPPEPEPTSPVLEAPPPKPLTMGLFYALCVITAGLALWSLISIVF